MTDNRAPSASVPEVTIVLPVYQEAENIPEMIRRLRAAVPGVDVLVVDDDSPDMTWKIAEDSGARVIRRVGERGLASALRRGIGEARGDIIGWMDADLSMPPEAVPRLLAAIGGGADVAVGSRYAPGGKDARPFLRVFTSRVINRFANLLLPVKVRDYDSGFVAARRKVLEAVPLSTEGHGEYCIEFLCGAGLRGFRIDEVGYVFTDRTAGKSKSAGGPLVFARFGIDYFRRVLAVRRQCRRARTP